jgi:hypothetical protein
MYTEKARSFFQDDDVDCSTWFLCEKPLLAEGYVDGHVPTPREGLQ